MSMPERPAALDALLAHVTDNLPDEPRAALTRLTKAARTDQDGTPDTGPLSLLRPCPRPEHHDPHDYDEDDQTGLHCLGLAEGESTGGIASPRERLAALEQQSTERARALLAPIEAKVREQKAQERAELRGATLGAAAEHLRTTLFPKVYEDAGQRTAEGVARAAGELQRLVADPGIPTIAWPSQRALDEATLDVPISISIRYVVRGRPEVPDEYNETRTIAPTEITLTYSATTDSQLGRIHTYVKGWWMHDGARVHSEAVGRHFTGDPATWPQWLAAEARAHDPVAAAEEQRAEQEAQAHLDQLAEDLANEASLPGVVRYRKRPVVVDTIQWTGDNEAAVQAFTGGPSRFYALDAEDREGSDDPEATATVFDELHSTWVLVYTGQHVVRGVKGEYYPIAEDVLADTYEPVNGSS